jgi:hypothetical protein
MAALSCTSGLDCIDCIECRLGSGGWRRVCTWVKYAKEEESRIAIVLEQSSTVTYCTDTFPAIATASAIIASSESPTLLQSLYPPKVKSSVNAMIEGDGRGDGSGDGSGVDRGVEADEG